MEARQIFFPYCIKRLEDGRFIVLNRYYKPLGFPNDGFIKYEEHPSAARLKITPSVARKLSYMGSEELQVIYLYNDGCIPTTGAEHMRAYLQRLDVLMKVKLRDA